MSAGSLSLVPSVPAGDAEPPLDGLVRRINGIVVGHGLAAILEVADAVVTHFHGGDYAASTRRSRSKAAGLRRLAEHPDLLLSKSTLHRYLSVARQVREMDHELAWRLTPSAHVALLPVRNTAEKTRLARAALENGWGSRELRKRARASGPPPVKRPGRPARPRVVAWTDQLARLLTPEQVQQLAREDLSGLSPDVLTGVLRQVSVALGRLSSVSLLVERELHRAKGEG